MPTGIYTAPMQPATDYEDTMSGEAIRFRCKPNALRMCWRCHKRHRAKNMSVQVFYDSTRHWCNDKDCAK